MRKSRFSESPIVGVIKESEAGANSRELCRRHGISTATLYKWKARFGGMEVSDVAKMHALEDENRRLKRIVANVYLTCAQTVSHVLADDVLRVDIQADT